MPARVLCHLLLKLPIERLLAATEAGAGMISAEQFDVRPRRTGTYESMIFS